MTKEMKIHESGERASGRTRTREYAEQIFISILPALPGVSLNKENLRPRAFCSSAEFWPKYKSSKKYFSVVAALYSGLSYLYNGIKKHAARKVPGRCILSQSVST